MALAMGVTGSMRSMTEGTCCQRAGVGVASALGAPRTTLACQRSVPISHSDIGPTRTPAERGLAGLGPSDREVGSLLLKAASNRESAKVAREDAGATNRHTAL